MARFNASIAAAMLFGIAACNSTSNETIANRNTNLEATVQNQRQEIDRLVSEGSGNKRRVKELEAQLEKGTETAVAVEEAKQEISAHVAEMLKRFRTDSQIKVESDPRGYRFVLTERVLFSSGSVDLTKEGKEALARVAEALRGNKFPAIVEGHTDNVPVVKPATLKKYPLGNIELSAHRALTVWEFLTKDGKVDETRLSITGHGPNRPAPGTRPISSAGTTVASRSTFSRSDLRIGFAKSDLPKPARISPACPSAYDASYL